MRRIIILPIFASAVALADDYSSQMQYAHTSSSATALSKSFAAGVGIASGGNASGGSGVGNGGTASLTYNAAPATAQRGTTTIRNTPDGYISNISPTADCMGVTTIGGSGPGIYVGGGTSWESENCLIGETARLFYSFGQKDDAIAILCTSEYAAAAPSCIAMKAKNAE